MYPALFSGDINVINSLGLLFRKVLLIVSWFDITLFWKNPFATILFAVYKKDYIQNVIPDLADITCTSPALLPTLPILSLCSKAPDKTIVVIFILSFDVRQSLCLLQ